MRRLLRTPSRRPSRDAAPPSEAAVSRGRYPGHPRCLGREPEKIRVRSAPPNRGGGRTTVACQQSPTGSEYHVGSRLEGPRVLDRFAWNALARVAPDSPMRRRERLHHREDEWRGVVLEVHRERDRHALGALAADE